MTMPQKSAASLLIIDDNAGSLEMLSTALAQPGPRSPPPPIPRKGWTCLQQAPATSSSRIS
jgi:hypothetical protein